MNTEQKSRAYDNLLKAIEDKRLAVVRCEIDYDIRGEYPPPMFGHDFVGEYIEAIDQQEILKELSDE